MTSSTRLILRLAPILALAAGAVVAFAVPTISLTTPDVTIVRPTSGLVTYQFFGTATASPGATLSGYGATYPYRLFSGQGTLDLDLGPNYVGQSTYTGLLLTVTVRADTALGYYGYSLESDYPANYFVYDSLNNGPERASYSVNVVPEPASLAALGLGAVALLRRRRV